MSTQTAGQSQCPHRLLAGPIIALNLKSQAKRARAVLIAATKVAAIYDAGDFQHEAARWSDSLRIVI